MRWELPHLGSGVYDTPLLGESVKGFLPHLRGGGSRATAPPALQETPPGPQAWKLGTGGGSDSSGQGGCLVWAPQNPAFLLSLPSSPTAPLLLYTVRDFRSGWRILVFNFCLTLSQSLLSVFDQNEGSAGVCLHRRSKDGSQIVPAKDLIRVLQRIFFLWMHVKKNFFF